MSRLSRGACWLIALRVTFAAPALAQYSPAAGESENSGQDPTRPVTRLDVRQDNSGDFGAQLLTLRADKPYMIDDGWKLSTRIDIPTVRNNALAPSNLDVRHEAGLGDLLTQARLLSTAIAVAGKAEGILH